MRKLSTLFVAASMLVLGASQAQAAASPYVGTLGIQIATLAATFTGTGVALVNSSGGGSHLNSVSFAPGDLATSGFVLPVTDPTVFPIAGIQVTAFNGTGAFNTAGGIMPIMGVAKVCLFGPCSLAAANVNVGLTVVGAGGVSFVTGAVNVTVTGAPWANTAPVAGTGSQFGFAHGPASGTSSTASVSGVRRYVTPIFISTNIGASAVVPAFGFFDIHFGVIPEPGTLVLLGSGIAGLVMVGRARARKS